MAKFLGPSGIELPGDPTDELHAATKRYVDSIDTGGGSKGNPYIIVASVDAPESTKASADYVCTGSNDHSPINSAIEAAEGEGGRGTVLLTGGRFYLGNSILMRTAVQLTGCGWWTELRGSSHNASGGAWVRLQSVNEHATGLSNLWINGNARHNVHGIAYDNTGGTLGSPDTSPDYLHKIVDVLVTYTGSSTGPADGIRFDGNTRVTKVTRTKVYLARRNGIVIDGSSDMHFTDCDIQTNDSGEGHGVIVGGGDNVFTSCKAFYCSRDGWQISSSRTSLVNCAAQDNGRHGFNFTNTFATTGSGLKADSNGRLVTGDGFYIDGSNININGSAYDRQQSPQNQRHGFNFVSGTNNIVTGLSRLNSGNDINGTPGSNSWVKIGLPSSVYEFGGGGGGSSSSPVVIPFHFPEVSTGTKGALFIAPFDFTLTSIRARLSSGSGVSCRAVVNGSNQSILSSIGTSVSSSSYNTSVSAGQIIQVSITGAGSNASGLSVTLGGIS